MNEHKLICMSLHKRGRKSYANWVVCWIKLQYRVKERNMYGNTHPTFFSGWTHKCHKSTRINWFTRLSPFSIFRMLDTKYETLFFSYINLNFLKKNLQWFECQDLEENISQNVTLSNLNLIICLCVKATSTLKMQQQRKNTQFTFLQKQQ